MLLATFSHSVFGYFTLPRASARRYNPAQIHAAALLILQSGE